MFLLEGFFFKARVSALDAGARAGFLSFEPATLLAKNRHEHE